MGKPLRCSLHFISFFPSLLFLCTGSMCPKRWLPSSFPGLRPPWTIQFKLNSTQLSPKSLTQVNQSVHLPQQGHNWILRCKQTFMVFVSHYWSVVCFINCDLKLTLSRGIHTWHICFSEVNRRRICLSRVSFLSSGNYTQLSPKALAHVNKCRAAHASDRCLESHQS